MPLSVEFGFSPTAEREDTPGGMEVCVLIAGALDFGEER
jgi:hypothetical protein